MQKILTYIQTFVHRVKKIFNKKQFTSFLVCCSMPYALIFYLFFCRHDKAGRFFGRRGCNINWFWLLIPTTLVTWGWLYEVKYVTLISFIVRGPNFQSIWKWAINQHSSRIFLPIKTTVLDLRTFLSIKLNNIENISVIPSYVSLNLV